MKNKIYITSELLAQTGLTEQQLNAWKEAKLLQPFGTADDGEPLYTDAELEQVQQITQLLSVGYDLKDIQSIIKKVGLPKQGKSESSRELKQYLTVGNLAEKVGVSPRTLKHWEAKGIIDADMRTEGGFRLYSENYIILCHLILDLQLFGYSLDEIKVLADSLRELIIFQGNLMHHSKTDAAVKIQGWTEKVDTIIGKFDSYRNAIQRWDDLLKKKKKELNNLKNQNNKRQTETEAQEKDEK